jgi:hypothetical protein
VQFACDPPVLPDLMDPELCVGTSATGSVVCFFYSCFTIFSILFGFFFTQNSTKWPKLCTYARPTYHTNTNLISVAGLPPAFAEGFDVTFCANVPAARQFLEASHGRNPVDVYRLLVGAWRGIINPMSTLLCLKKRKEGS